MSNDGRFERLDLTTETRVKIGFTAEIEQSLAPLLYFPWQLEDGDVVVRIAQDPAMSPAGTHIAFTALIASIFTTLNRAQRSPFHLPAGLRFSPPGRPTGQGLHTSIGHRAAGTCGHYACGAGGQPKSRACQPTTATQSFRLTDSELSPCDKVRMTA